MTQTRQLLAAVAGFVLLAGCSAAAPAQTAPASMPAASETTGATSQAPASGTDISVDDFLGQLKNAQVAVKTYTMDLTMETEMLGKATKVVMSGAIDQTTLTQINMSMDMDVAGMQMKLLKVDGDMYVQLGATGKQWLKVPKSQMAQYEGTADSADLTAGLEKARSATKKVTYVGDEAVEGTNTRHYVITMDSAGLSKLTGSGATLSGETFDYDLWLDEAGRMRKVAMDVKAEVEGKSLPMTMAGVMGHYDEPVDITAPAKEDVTNLPG